MYGERNYWRDTQRPARFLCFDSRIVAFIGLALLHFRVWTLILLAIAAVCFLWMDWKGINPADAIRHLCAYFAGPVVPARPRHELRRPVDFGFEALNPPRLKDSEPALPDERKALALEERNSAALRRDHGGHTPNASTF